MPSAFHVFALDLATKMGFATGPAGEKPRVGEKRLKDAEDDPERGFRKLGIWLRDEFTLQIPDLVIVEAALPIGAMVDWDGGADGRPKFKSNPQTIYFLNGLVAVVHGICGPYGVRCVNVSVQKVRKHFLGIARPADPKRAVLARCHQLGLIPKTERSDNIGDAIALHDYAGATFGRAIPAQLILHGESPAPETIESVFGGRAP